MRLCAFTLAACLLGFGEAMAGAPPDAVRVSVQFDRVVGNVSPYLFGCALPAPGSPGADALLPELLRNRSFEKGHRGAWRPPAWIVGNSRAHECPALSTVCPEKASGARRRKRHFVGKKHLQRLTP